MDLPPNFLRPSGIVSILPQYINSEAMYERFLSATLDEEEEISRAINSRGIKVIDEFETEFDNLDYFYKNKLSLEEEFFNELCSAITEEKAVLFSDIISNHWFDGRIQRQSLPVLQLMASIENYLVEYGKVKKKENIRVQLRVTDDVDINFESDEIYEILQLNSQLLYVHIQKWLEGHSNYLHITSSDIHYRRGLHLKELFDTEEYLERQDINSYSLAFSVTEKFSQMAPKAIPVIVNTNIINLRDRVLFFSPFIKNMPPYQLELGVIPAWWKQKIEYQGQFGNIHEYLID